MRPARKGPENLDEPLVSPHRRLGFNEAGPQGAGKPLESERLYALRSCGFNEAGPQGAGKPPHVRERYGDRLALQ